MVQKEVKALLLFGLFLMAIILLINLRNIKAVLLILFTILLFNLQKNIIYKAFLLFK